MARIEESVFSTLAFPVDAEVSFDEKVLKITKWNWDYKDCENFQKELQPIINKNKDHKAYIFCNHPHCFTLGRGNERGQDELVDFDPELEKFLDFPVHRIHRGGGLTFHYPGQWIFYPIVSINQRYTLEDHMCWMLKTVKEVLRDSFGVEKAMATKKLMGVWVDRRKMASIGVGLSRFVTQHGLALNLVNDEKMFNELKKVAPCGMNPETYITLDSLYKKGADELVKNFHSAYIKTI